MRRPFTYVGLGALIAYFFDPENGRRRRALAGQKIPALFRSGSRRVGRAVSSRAQGMKQQVTYRQEAEKPPPNDPTLAQKVESEIFRDVDVPKGDVNVNAEGGRVVLRGEIDSAELIQELEERARKVQGVEEVENLLHVSGTPAPA
jgi:hypothetical protein